MKSPRKTRSILSFLLLLSAGISHAARLVSVGVPPNEASRPLAELSQRLSQRSGLKVQVSAPGDYQELLKRFRSGKIDFAFLSGLNFVQLEREGLAKVLLKKVYTQGGEFYYTAILARADSSYKKVSDLRGARFGFVDPQSTSGYLVARMMLQKAGLDAGPGLTVGSNVLTHEFLGTHEKNLQALLDKRLDAVAVWGSDPEQRAGVWTELAAFRGNAKDLRVLAFSDPIPNDAFVVRKALWDKEPALVLKMMDAFIAMEDDEQKILQKVFGIDRLVTATSKHYDSIRALEPLLEKAAKK